MNKKIKIFKLNIIFVFRHKWDDHSKKSGTDFRNYVLGIWFRKQSIVGDNNKGISAFKSKNLINDYIFGINLLVCKFWINFNFG